ncbi:MAG TPA: ribonuclease III family protein [Candidatus Sulfotelmatobacter sp.]|nr:ribonuclease III family protein [Candidatus Sulfotelmatobacter sp.]
MPQRKIAKPFLKEYNSLTQILTDKSLAALGDAYINFAYSLAISKKIKKPYGKKVKGTPLAEAIRKTGLREALPSRIDKHILSDAAEALLVYAWLNELTTLEEAVEVLEKNDLESALIELLLKAKERIKL